MPKLGIVTRTKARDRAGPEKQCDLHCGTGVPATIPRAPVGSFNVAGGFFMYSVVMMMAMTGTPDLPAFGKRRGGCDGGCQGGYAGSCYGGGGCHGYADSCGCSGGGRMSRRDRRGCHGGG